MDFILTPPVTEGALNRVIAQFLRQEAPRRRRLWDYYAGQQGVKKGRVARGRPDNRLTSPFPRYITEVHTGYFYGMPATCEYETERQQALWTPLLQQLNFDSLLYAAARDASVCGKGYIQCFTNREDGIRLCRLDPCMTFVTVDDTALRRPTGAVRLWRDPDGGQLGQWFDAERTILFRWDQGHVAVQTAVHNYTGVCPVVEFCNNEDGMGDFESVTELIDAYDLLLSGAMDDMQSVANAFLALYGMQGTTQEDIDNANLTRVLSLSEGGKAEFVVKQLNSEAISLLRDALRSDILQLSMTPDLSDESFASAASGVALQYKLWGIEQIRAAKERCFTAAMHRLLNTIYHGMALLGMAERPACTLTFYKNLPQDTDAQLDALLKLSGQLSHRTILEHLPMVKDTDEELRRLAEEQSQTPTEQEEA